MRISIFSALAVIFASLTEASPVSTNIDSSLKARGTSPFNIDGNSGIAAMHIAVTEPTKIVIIDKSENDPIKLPNKVSVISVEYDITDGSKRILPLTTNTFCSAGSFMGNGSLVNTGGAEVSGFYKPGFQTLRILNPCEDGKCEWSENPTGMTSMRWYPSVVTLSDGRLFILGGSTKSTGVNNATINNPTYEFFPKTNPKPIHFQFLVDTLPFNLYPDMHLMPGPAGQTQLFIFANKDSIIWDWTKNTVVKKLPQIQGASRSYPLTGTSVMLPLDPDNNYKPQILMCGGNVKRDHLSPAADSCGRIDLSNLDTATWEMDNFGGLGRVMPDAVVLSDGKTLFLNGAGRGIAGYNSKDKATGKVTQLADQPVLTPLLYDFRKPLGQRWAKQGASTIPRLYHSVATLIPDGRVFVAGSSPQANVVTNGTQFPTEFRVEYFSPPYITQTKHPRPVITSVAGSTKLNQGPIRISYNKNVAVNVKLAASEGEFTAALIHYGFVTHSVHMSQRYVICKVSNVEKTKDGFSMDVLTPTNPNIIAPGVSYLSINYQGIPVTTSVQVLLS